MSDHEILETLQGFTPSLSLGLKLEMMCRYLHAHNYSGAYYSFTSHDQGFEVSRFTAIKPGETIDYYIGSTLDHLIQIAPGLTISDLNEKILDEFGEEFFDEIDSGEGYQEFEMHLNSAPSERGQVKWSFLVDYSAAKESTEDHAYERDAEHYEDDESYALLIAMMKEKNLDTFSFSFGGGGDSGDLQDIECSLSKSEMEEKCWDIGNDTKTSFLELASEFCLSEATGVGNWWDNDGGSGSITVNQDGAVVIEVSYYENSNELIFKDVPMNMPFEIKTGTPQKKPNPEKSLEN